MFLLERVSFLKKGNERTYTLQVNGVSLPELSPMQGGSLIPGRPMSFTPTSSSSSSFSCFSSLKLPLSQLLSP